MPDVATLELTGAVAGSLAPTVTLHDVELVETGMHPGSTGPTPVERADLESMIAAAADPEVHRAAVHPGHFDPRFVQALADGEPAIGWAVPRRIVDVGGKSKLIGDLVDVPAKLAAIIPKAYARRSIEFSPQVTSSGRAYRAAMSGLALLGVAIPAVRGLADVVNRYSAGPPLTVGPQVFLSDTPTPDAVFHAAWWSSGHDGGRADLLPMEGGALMPRFDTARYQALLAEESTRHAQAMSGLLSQAAVADAPAPPLPGFPGLPAPAVAPAAPAGYPPAAPAGYAYNATGQLVPAAPAAAAPPAAPPAAAPAAPGWPAPATAPAPATPVAGYPAGWPAPAAPVPPAHPAMPAAPPLSPFAPPAAPAAGWPAAPAPAAPAAPAGYPAGYPVAPAPAAAPATPAPGATDPTAGGLVATLSAGQMAELQARAARGDMAMQALEAQQREHYLSAAVGEGRISIAERNAWAAQMQRDMAGTVALLSALTPGRVPVQPLGHALAAGNPAAATGGVPDAAWDAWEAETFGIAAPAAPAPAAAAGVAAPFAPAGV